MQNAKHGQQASVNKNVSNRKCENHEIAELLSEMLSPKAGIYGSDTTFSLYRPVIKVIKDADPVP